MNFSIGSTTTSNKTFVFDLDTKIKYPIKDGGKNAICTSNKSGPCFGEKDLWIDFKTTITRYSGHVTEYKFKSTPSNVFEGSPFEYLTTGTYVVEVFYRL